MAIFLNPQGREVTADEALINGRIRPNYREILTNGESVATDIFQMDSVQRRTGEVYLTDSAARKLAEERGKAARDYIRDNRYSGYPMIQSSEGDNPAPPSIGKMSGSDAVAAIRNARYA